MDIDRYAVAIGAVLSAFWEVAKFALTDLKMWCYCK